MIYIYITFDSTSRAIHSYSITENIENTELVPLRPEIDAGCGLALRSKIENAETILNKLTNENISCSGIYILDYTSSRVTPLIKKYEK